MAFNWKQAVGVIGPYILAASGVPAPLIPVVVHGINEAEQLFGPDKGQEKLTHVVNLAQDTISGINTVKPGLVDPNVANSTLISGINTTVGVLNLVHPKDQNEAVNR